MKPIINPLWFYLANVIENVGLLSAAVLIFSSSILIVLLICGMVGCFQIEKYTQNFKQLFIVFVVSTILTILCPTKDTCYQMMTMSVITPNNITAVGETATDVIDYVVESIDTLLENKEEK
jgi:hypothetical protein